MKRAVCTVGAAIFSSWLFDIVNSDNQRRRISRDPITLRGRRRWSEGLCQVRGRKVMQGQMWTCYLRRASIAASFYPSILRGGELSVQRALFYVRGFMYAAPKTCDFQKCSPSKRTVRSFRAERTPTTALRCWFSRFARARDGSGRGRFSNLAVSTRSKTCAQKGVMRIAL